MPLHFFEIHSRIPGDGFSELLDDCLSCDLSWITRAILFIRSAATHEFQLLSTTLQKTNLVLSWTPIMKQIQFSTAHFFRSRVFFWCKTSHSLLCLPKTQHQKHASSHINAILRRRRRSWRNTRSWPILWLPTCLKAMRSHDCHIETWHQQNKINTLISNHQQKCERLWKYVNHL